MLRPLHHRPWLSEATADRVGGLAAASGDLPPTGVRALVEDLAQRNRTIHDVEAVNLNPASNVMNPRAEAMLAAGLSSRASLGYPGEKYETGLEAIEQIEVVAAQLACQVFDSRYAEVRVGSGALGNLYAFMATCEPGQTIIAPPTQIGGHVTHHGPGAAGLYRLNTVDAPVRADGYTVDVDALARLAREVRPRLITIGGSLNLVEHPVARIREVADEVGARVLFDAAHLCGMVAGGVWRAPLAEGAHLMTMSTYKSLGGPAGGLLVSNDDELAQRVEQIAFPGMTANFDAGRVAALALTLLDWTVAGAGYARAMADTALALAEELDERGVPVLRTEQGFTTTHQLAVLAAPYGGGQRAAYRLREAGLLACGIGLPVEEVDGDLNGLRLGTPEIVRRGMTPADMPRLADLLVRGLDPRADHATVAADVRAWRAPFDRVRYTLDDPVTG